MKSVVLLLVFLMGLAACSRKPKGTSPDRVTSGPDGKWHLDGKPWSGKQIDKFPSGKPSFEGELVDGLEHGVWTWYFENGNTKSRMVFELGVQNGNETIYYDNADNTRKWVKTWKRGDFVESYQWQKDGTPILPKPQLDTGTVRAMP